MLPAAQGSPAAKPKNLKEAQAEIDRLQSVNQLLLEKIQQVQAQAANERNKTVRMFQMMPCVAEDRDARNIFLDQDHVGDLSSLEAKQIPGTHLHLTYLTTSIGTLKGLTEKLRKALLIVKTDFSAYEGQERQVIIDLHETQRELFEEVKLLVPAEVTRQKLEMEKGKTLRLKAILFQDGKLESEWKQIKHDYGSLTDVIEYLENVVYPLRGVMGLAREFKELSQALETCRDTEPNQHLLEPLRQQRTFLRDRLRGLSGSYAAFSRTPFPIELDVREAISSQYLFCEREELYTSHLIDVIDFDNALTRVLKKINWEPVQETRLQLNETGNFQEQVNKFSQLKQQYDAIKELLSRLAGPYKARSKFLDQERSTVEKCATLLSRHHHELKTLWNCAELRLVEFQFELQSLAYRIGAEVRERTLVFQKALQEEIALLRTLQSQQGVSNVEGVEQKIKEHAPLLKEEGLKTMIHHLSALGGIMGMFIPKSPFEENDLKTSQDRQISSEWMVGLKGRYDVFNARVLEHYQILCQLSSAWQILRANRTAIKHAQDLLEAQNSLLSRGGVFLRNAQALANGEMVDSFNNQIQAVSTRKKAFFIELDELAKFEQLIEKDRAVLSETFDLLGEQLASPPHEIYIKMTRDRFRSLAAQVEKNDAALAILAHEISRIVPSRKQNAV